MQLDLLTVLVVLLGLSMIGLVAARKLKLPGLVGMLVMGVLVRMVADFYGLPAFQDGIVADLANVGVTLLLFLLGVEFSVASLGSFKWLSILGACLQMALTTILGIGALFLMGITGSSAVIISLGLSLSSTAVVARLLTEQGRSNTLTGRIMIGWLLVQDLAVLPILLFLPFLLPAGEFSFNFVGLGLVLGFVGVLALTLNRVFDFLAKIGERELLILAASVLGLGMGILFEWAGLSLALGGFVAGMLLSNASEKHEIFAKLSSLRDLFSSIFFLSLGILVSPSAVVSFWPLILGLVLIFGLLKFILILIELLLWGIHLRVATGVSLGLFEAGEFAFVIGGVALGLSVLDEVSLSILSSVVILSMLVVPLMLALEERIYKIILMILNKLGFKFNRVSGDLKKLPFVNHVVIFGHGRVGRLVAEKLRKKLKKDKLVVIDYDLNEVNKLVSEGVSCFFGDALEDEVLEVACLDKAKMIIVVLPDLKTTKQVVVEARKMNKKAYIMARAHRHNQIGELKDLGADRVVVVEESVGRLMYSYVKNRI